MSVGRDMVRVIWECKYFVPEFQALWDDMIQNPKVLDDTEQPHDIHSLVLQPTRFKYLTGRITAEMEKQLLYLMTQVKMGNQRRYQQWFAQKFLTQSETVIIDIIRFICCSFHPPNHIIAANFVPRWATIGWLLKSITVRKWPYLMNTNFRHLLYLIEPKLRLFMTIYFSIPSLTV